MEKMGTDSLQPANFRPYVDIHVGELFQAVQEGNFRQLEFLARNGANLNAISKYGETALMVAARNGQLDCVRFLADHGANVGQTDSNNEWTALFWAVFSGHLDCVKLLTKMGADVNAKTRSGSTALMVASRGGFIRIVEVLIDHGADVNVVNRSGSNALIEASHGGRLDCARLLVKKGRADINAANEDGWTALMVAAHFGASEFVRLLVENGADVSAKTNNGDSALIHAHHASPRTSTAIVAFLVLYSNKKAEKPSFQLETRLIGAIKKMLYCGARIRVEPSNGTVNYELPNVNYELPSDCWPILSLQAACRASIWQQLVSSSRRIDDIPGIIHSKLGGVLPDTLVEYLTNI